MSTNEPLKLGRPLPQIVERELSYQIQGGFYDTFNEMGPGLSEVLYSRALEIVLEERGLVVEREYPITVTFRRRQIGFHRLDMLVERRVILEIKAGQKLPAIALPQLRNYLGITKLELGILLHFGVKPVFYRELRGFDHPKNSMD
jgi:GxxExxY protein